MCSSISNHWLVINWLHNVKCGKISVYLIYFTAILIRSAIDNYLCFFFTFRSIKVTRSLDVCSTSPDSVMPTMNPEDSCNDTAPIGPMIYIFMSQFVSGIGTTLFSILGITYLDDNVKRKQTPMLIGKLYLILGGNYTDRLTSTFLYRTYVKSSIDRPSLWIRSSCHLYADVRQSERDNDT